MSTNPPTGPDNGNTPNIPGNSLNIIAKLIDKIPMKFNKHQSYCLVAGIVLLVFMLVLWSSSASFKWSVYGFPSAIDLRIMLYAGIGAILYAILFGKVK